MQTRRWISQRLCCLRRVLIIITCVTLVTIFRGHSSIGDMQSPQMGLSMEVTSKSAGVKLNKHQNFVRDKFRRRKVNERMSLIKRRPIAAIPMEKLLTPATESPRIIDQPTRIAHYGNIIVHFDLKGAPPKVNYLKQVLELIKRNGATGILIEWEDTFPFTGIFEDNRSTEGYTMAEVKEILSFAQTLGLDIIPLVQTFGHLEWILKVQKFRKYRQNDMYPQVICLADEEAVGLVHEAIRQVADIHKQFGMRYFHIGADEAFEYGTCEKDVVFISQQKADGKERLGVQHLSKIAKYVRSLVPYTRVLAWYDMLRTFSAEVITEYKLGDLIEPVVWDYSETVQQQNEWTWQSLASSFKNVWGSSAFKGASNPSSQLIDIRHYVANNKAWLQQKNRFGGLFENFRGIILTGWQRYDHFAVLCELLPVAIPSVVANLHIAAGVDSGNERLLEKKVSEALRCTEVVSLSDPDRFAGCAFPGSDLFEAIHVLLKQQTNAVKRSVFEDYQVKGWLGRMNTRHNYSQLWYLNGLINVVQSNFFSMRSMEKLIRSVMEPIYRKNTIDEWIYEYVDPITEQLERYLKDIGRLWHIREFPKRNFEILRDLKPI